jgi:hypothetical protein
MTIQDRTYEFHSLIGLTKDRMMNTFEYKKAQSNQNDEPIELSPFIKHLGILTNRMNHTEKSIVSLHKLVSIHTPFDDHLRAILTLALHVKHAIQEHHVSIRDMKAIATKKNQDHSHKHQDLVISGIQSKLLYFTQWFQNILKRRAKQVKKQSGRRNMYQSIPILNHNDQKQETVIQIDQLYDSHHDYTRLRSIEVNEISRDIVELSSMFNHLAIMVKQQGELTRRIDDNMQDAHENTKRGHQELLKYFKRMSSSTVLILKILLVLIVFIIFVGIFIV